MTERSEQQRSAVVFGARNLGRAVIELLLADGWSVAAGAVSDATLAAVTASGALALRADVTDPESVHRVLSGGGRRPRRDRPRRQRCLGLRWRSQRPVRRRAGLRGGPRGIRCLGDGPGPVGLLFPLGVGCVPARAGTARDGDPGDGWLLAARGCGERFVGGRRVRRSAIAQAAALELRERGSTWRCSSSMRASSPGGSACRHGRGGTRRPARARCGGPLSRRPGGAGHHPRAAGDTARRALGALAPAAPST